jgi:hypothetical protein
MWWEYIEEIEIVEVMKYMWRSYDQFINTPFIIIDTVKTRMSLEAKQIKNGK